MRMSPRAAMVCCAVWTVVWTAIGYPEASTPFLAAIAVIASLPTRKDGE